jgi:membrane protease YdiL (CAAX protease family)
LDADEMKTLKTVTLRRPLLVFFILAYLFAWIWYPLIAISPVYGLPGLFAPALAACIVVWITGGRTEVGRLIRKLAIWRVGWFWYLVALALPFALSYIVAMLAGYIDPGSDFQLAPITPLAAIVFVLVVGEEIGWRGYAQSQLEKSFTPLLAAIILGVLWGFWHLPNFFIPGLPHNDIPLPAYIVYTISLSILAAWLLKYTHGSVLIATLFHGSTNTFGFLTPEIDTATRWWLIAGAYGSSAFLVAMIFGKRLHRSGFAGRAGPDMSPGPPTNI